MVQSRNVGAKEYEIEPLKAFPITRSKRRLQNKDNDETAEPIRSEREDYSIHTPSSGTILSGDRHTEVNGSSSVEPILERRKISWVNVPRQPIPQLEDVSLWIGHQLHHKRMPKEYQHLHPEGELIASLDGYPEGLLAIPNKDGFPRIIVPRTQIKALVLQLKH